MRLGEQTRCRLQTWLTAAALLFVARSTMLAQTAKALAADACYNETLQ